MRVNKAAEKQIEAINNSPEATKEEKIKAIEQVEMQIKLKLLKILLTLLPQLNLS